MSRVGFLAGFTAGLTAGLFIAWQVLLPAEITGEPHGLTVNAKEQYVLLTSMSLAFDGDVAQARRRLDLLREHDIRARLIEQAERYALEGKPDVQLSSLARMALALGGDTAALRGFALTPTVRVVPLGTVGPRPTASAFPMPGAARAATPETRSSFRLVERVRVACERQQAATPRILVFVQGADGAGVPATRVRVQWDDAQDDFFTGFKSSDLGFADFDMQPGKTYSVMVVDGASQIATGLATDMLEPECPADGKAHFQAWRVVFRRSP